MQMNKTNVIYDTQDLAFTVSADLDKVRTVMELLGSSSYLNCNKLDDEELSLLKFNHPNNVNLYAVIYDYLFEMDNHINEIMAKLAVLKDEIRTGENNENSNDC